MTPFLQDLTQATRALRRHPAYTVAAVLTLAVGLAAITAMYTVLERVVLDPLPYPDADRLVRLKSAVPGVAEGTEWDVSQGAWWYFAGEAGTLETVGAYRRGGATVLGERGPERVRTAQATAATLRLLGAEPVRGRLFNEEDDDPGATAVAMISASLWRGEYGGDPAIVGRAITLDERPVEVVGVVGDGARLPPEMGVPSEMVRTDVWLPLTLDPAGPFWNSHMEFRTIARLADGATLEAAQEELDRLTARLPEVVPNAYSSAFMERYGFATRAYPLKDYAVGEIAGNLWMLFGAVALVLTIACANVANLFLVRAEGRRREVAVRTALGAGRGSIARTFLAEGLVLALVGAAVALPLSSWGVGWLGLLAPPGVPRLDRLQPDGSVVAFILGLALLVALLLAAVPLARSALGEARLNLSDGARGATPGRERQRIRSGLLVTQVALALVLLVGAGLLLESFRRLRAVDPGVEAEGVVVATLHLPWARYNDRDSMWRFYDRALDRVRAVPGVEAAGLTGSLPFAGGFGCTVQGFEDPAVAERLAAAGSTLCAGQEPTSPGYFEAMGIPVVRGRGLTQADHDQPERGAVVVSQTFAERFWPGEDPIGKGVGPGGRSEPPFYRVVGVAGDVFAGSPAGPPAVAIYYPVTPIPGTGGWWPSSLRLVVRAGQGNPLALVGALRAAIHDVDPAVPLADPRTLESLQAGSMARLSFSMLLIALAAVVAVFLAAIGLYGVVTYLVARRRKEIGVRVALGARPRQVQAMVVAGSARLTALGLGIGVLAAIGLSRLLRGLLFGVEPGHPVAYVIAAALLGAVAVAGAWVPARRAARVDPVEALRAE